MKLLWLRRIAIPILLFLIALATILSISTQAFGQSKGKVLMVPREGYSTDIDLMIKMEVGVMTMLLKNAGYDVEIATTSGQPILGPTQKIEKIARLSEIKPDDYVGVIMPCMAVGMFPGPPVAPATVAIVKKALADGKPVAAAANSSIILAEAGLLKGKKYTFATDPLNPGGAWKRTDQRFQGAVYNGPGVVQDGLIITSGVCPNLHARSGLQDGTIELTKKFIAAMGSK